MKIRKAAECVLIVVTLFIILVIPGASLAQPTGGGPGGTPPAIPVTGVEILLLGGGIFGAKKIYNHMKKKKN